ncbi:glycosyltransferase [Candidatus Gottesmanbacteria bacterium]|nr:glycosyltransferase [Candidatus Gottesmanbacteria bacterium]
MKSIYLSIVIPAYNEETNIRLGALDKVFRYLETVSYPWEVIIVDDGSSDETGALMEEFRSTNVSVIHSPHQGKASTVIAGVLAARGEIVLFTDLDQAAPIREIEKLLPWFRNNYDVVIGSRNTRREGAPLLRLVMARGFMMLRSVLLGLGDIRDTQCGFKAFKQRSARRIFQRLKLYGQRHRVEGSMVTAGFDIEVLFLARIMGYQIKEVPIEWHYVETRRVNPVKDSWQGFMDIVRIRLNAWRGLYIG